MRTRHKIKGEIVRKSNKTNGEEVERIRHKRKREEVVRKRNKTNREEVERTRHKMKKEEAVRKRNEIKRWRRQLMRMRNGIKGE